MVISRDSERVSLATGGREFHREIEDGKKELEKEDDLEKGTRKLEG